MEKGLSSSSSSSSSSSDSLNGLKFGKKIYFEGVASGFEQPEAAPPQSPAKKGRTAVAQPPRCQVEGCRVDLSGAKAYYSRHKVCGMHSKFPKVIVDGLDQRFCQQCSKFHQLPEFDQGKRSCRRRLAGHNERRRKPPQGPLLSSRYASFSPSTFDAWPNASEQGSTNQTTITSKYQVPWQSQSQAPQGSTAQAGYPGPGLSSRDCFSGVSNSTTALSLLSNTNNFLATNGATIGEPSLNPSASIGQFPGSSWDLKGNQANSSLYEMPPDMGLAQISHPSARPDDDEQCNELELSGGYDSSVQHMNWSL